MNEAPWTNLDDYEQLNKLRQFCNNKRNKKGSFCDEISPIQT